MRRNMIALGVFLFAAGCFKNEDTINPQTNNSSISNNSNLGYNGNENGNNSCSQVIAEGKVFNSNGATYLWGGNDASEHFNITGWLLDPCNLYYGLGREHFEVPKNLEFVKLSEVSENFDDIEKVLVLKTEENIRVYPYSILVKSEMVNDEADGEPIMVVYCFLADLAAVYTRVYDERTLVFGVSGYTYADPDISNGAESFVLWDRETESLWWPIIDKGVSGAYKGVKMDKHPEDKWEISRWGNVKEKYPGAYVMKDFESSGSEDKLS